MNKTVSPLVVKARGVEPPSSLCSVKLFARKFDREILYAECDEDFIDSLVSFLVLPLELAYTLSNDNTNLRCVGNLCKSPCRRASASSFHQFPKFYNCKSNEPLRQSTHSSPAYQCLIPLHVKYSTDCIFTRQIDRSLLSSTGDKIMNVYPNNPKLKQGISSSGGNGFMKRNIKFIVSSDLVISSIKSTSMIDFLKKMSLGIRDLEEHEITISKSELINILRASLISSSALTNGLSSFLTEKMKLET